MLKFNTSSNQNLFKQIINRIINDCIVSAKTPEAKKRLVKAALAVRDEEWDPK
jgi:hypothetical protein